MERKKVFIGTPMYGGMCHGAYANSCINLLNTLNHAMIDVIFYFIYDDALVARARNTMVNEFLKTDCSHLMFIDADIQFNPQDVLSLLQTNEDIVGGAYAKKTLNWKKIVDAVKTIPNLNPQDVERFGGDYVYNSYTPMTDVNTLFEVDEIGTGFMLIRRGVFSKMMSTYPQLQYVNDNGEQMYCFFSTLIDNQGAITGGNTNRYLSEDYAFCMMWKKLGGKIKLAPWVVLKHIGNYFYTCDLPFIINQFKK